MVIKKVQKIFLELQYRMMLQLPRNFDELVKPASMNLQQNTLYDFNTIMDVSKRFKLSLHDSAVLSDLRADFIDIKAGNSYEILITPTLTRVSQDNILN